MPNESKKKTPSNGFVRQTRSRDTALAAAEAADPVWLQRLLATDEQVNETMETLYAQSARRDEAAYELAVAGVAYNDLARILGCTGERIRYIVARHLGIPVRELNPKNTALAPDRH